MASTTNMVYSGTGSADDVILTAIINTAMIPAAYAFPVAAPLIRVKDLRQASTRAFNFPKWPKLSAAAVNENADLSNTAISTSTVQVSSGEKGIMVNLSDVLTDSQVIGAAQVQGVMEQTGLSQVEARKLVAYYPYVSELARAVAEKIDTDIIALAASAGLSAGTSGADMQIDDFLTGIYNLENANCPGTFAAILHPIQIADLRKDVITNNAAAFSMVPDAVKNALLQATNDGFVTNLMGVDVYRSTLCASVNTAADRQGMMFPMGNDPTNGLSPLGMTLNRLVRAEFERDASLRSTEAVVTADYGVGVVNSSWLTDITTDKET